MCSIDLAANDEADVNVLVNPKDEWLTQESVVTQAIQKHVGSQKVDSILNMAGNKNCLLKAQKVNNILFLFYAIAYDDISSFFRRLGWRFCKFRRFYQEF